MTLWYRPRGPCSNLLLASISEATLSGHRPTEPHTLLPNDQTHGSSISSEVERHETLPNLQNGANVVSSAKASEHGMSEAPVPLCSSADSSASVLHSGEGGSRWPIAAGSSGPPAPEPLSSQLLSVDSSFTSSIKPPLHHKAQPHNVAKQVQQFLGALQRNSELLQQPVDCGERQLATRIRESPIGPKIAFIAGVHALISAQVEIVRRHLPRPRRSAHRNCHKYDDGKEHSSARSEQRHSRWHQECRSRHSGSSAAAAAAAAASAAATAEREAKRLMDMGFAAEREQQPGDAAHHFEAAAALRPNDPELLSRWSKQLSDLSYMAGVTPPDVISANARAIDIARSAVAVAPDCPLGYVASCVSRGRLALVSDNKTKLTLAKEAQEDAETALRLDARNDIAHHLLGRWHYEMAGINFVCRTLVRMVYGATLFPGTYQGALKHFATATSIAPGRLIHRVELGRTLHKLGDHAEALKQLEDALQLEVEDVNAYLSKKEAEMLLAQLRKHHAGSLLGPGLGLLASVRPLEVDSTESEPAAKSALEAESRA